MIATVEEQCLMEKWKKRLCLHEWRIKPVTHLRPDACCVEWKEKKK